MLFRSPALLTYLYPQLVWRIPTTEKCIFITFDDGPTPGPTDFVLSTLNVHNAKATFFCLGKNVVENPGLFQKIQHDNHEIGNHTYNHLEGWGCSSQEYLEDIQKCQATMQQATLFRPPYGKIKYKQIKQLSNFQIIMWDVLSFDFLRWMSPQTCLRGIIKATRPGSIVVFHDSYKAEEYLQFILPRYMAHCAEQGFFFKTIPTH